ncbi:MAG: 23S rRNA (adenine(2503)-C(2))-methyltransferase RlmN, partial [Oscillospiraceae bacterium]
MIERQDVKSMSLSELQALLVSMGEPPFRARQLFRWLHHERVGSFDEMTNLSAALRGRLD